jgi:glycosyltransferase involved in cell wall biosynthesis
MGKIELIINDLSANYGLLGLILVGAIIVLFIIQIALYLGLYRRIAKFRLTKKKTIREQEPAISVVVPLFAEDYNYLDHSLTTLLTQDYSKFEVIVVYVGKSNDFFSDIKSLQRLYPNLSPIQIDYSPRYPVSTKIALNVGIKSAKYDFIVTTTAAATPASERWLSLLAKGFLYGDITIGYSGMQRQRGLRNFIFREYQFNESMNWLSSAMRRRAYSASRNAFGFKKSLYFDVRGYKHLDMNAGENDLFLQQIATRDNVSVVLTPRAATTERIWGGWSWWWNRIKLLHATHRYYPKWAMAPTISELLFRTLFFAAIIATLVLLPYPFKMMALTLLAIRYLLVQAVVIRNSRRVGESGLATLHFIYDIIEPILRLFVALASKRTHKKRWS